MVDWWQVTFQSASKSDLTGLLANLAILEPAIAACKLSGMRRNAGFPCGVLLRCSSVHLRT